MNWKIEMLIIVLLAIGALALAGLLPGPGW